MTHDELVKRAALWLRTRTPAVIVITEMVTGHESPDAIGFSSSGYTWLLECKVSRADFQRDLKKPRTVAGGMGDHRYYLTPPGLIEAAQVPAGWGLLEAYPKQYRLVVKPDPPPYRDHPHRPDKSVRDEYGLLVSALRRIGQDPPEGLSVAAYTFDTKRRATLGVKI